MTVTYDYGVEADWREISSASTGTIGRSFTAGGQLSGWTRKVDGETLVTASYEYDKGRLRIETDQFGNKTRYDYDEFGRVFRVGPVSESDPDGPFLEGNYVEYSYDNIGRVLTESRHYIDSMSTNRVEVTTYDYSDSDGTQTVTNARNYATESSVSGLIASVRSPLQPNGGGYDDITNVTRTNQVIRNPAGLPTNYINPDGTQSIIEYRNSDTLGDAEQFPTLIRDESGRDRVYTYYEDGRLETSTDLTGQIETQFTYVDVPPGLMDDDDGYVEHLPDGGRLEVVDLPGPGSITYFYNLDGRLVRIERPGFGAYAVSDGDGDGELDFTPDGEPMTVSLPSGETVETMYHDDAKQVRFRTVTDVTAQETEKLEFQYDPNTQNLVRTVNLHQGVPGTSTVPENGDEAVYAYYDDANALHNGKLKSIIFASGMSISYEYDGVGRVGKISTKTGPTATPQDTIYEYDEVGNISKVHDPANASGFTSFTYDELGRLKTRTLPNGIFTKWTFDSRDRLTEIAHFENEDAGNPGEGVSLIVSFAYDHPARAVGEPHRITKTIADGTSTYIDLFYDDALRVLKEEYYDEANALERTIEYEYDDQGNRTSRTETVNGTPSQELYEINETDGYQLEKTSGPDGVLGDGNDLEYAHDDGGRVTGIPRDGGWTLEYNASGQVKSVTRANASDHAYEYDAFGRRISSNDGTNTVEFLIAPAAQRLGPGALDV
ncbi:MAG: RHS repeat protein, partial [Planctomycetales bacterium]|nr:RHS repeat protein [Planctomycetales bacterium]